MRFWSDMLILSHAMLRQSRGLRWPRYLPQEFCPIKEFRVVKVTPYLKSESKPLVCAYRPSSE